MKKKFMMRAFSLMEMMIVLLIVAIIAAATAPMISKKMMRQTGTGDSPWVFTGTGNSIAFNMRGNPNDPVIIGANSAGDGGQRAPLYIRTNPFFNLAALRAGDGVNGGQAITFADNDNNVVGHLGMMSQTAFLSNIIPAEPGGNNAGAVILGHIRSLTRNENDGRSDYIANKILVGYNNDLTISDINDASQDVIIASNSNLSLHGDNPNAFEANIIIGNGINRIGQDNGGPTGDLSKTIAIGSSQSIPNSATECIFIGDSVQGSGNHSIAMGQGASANGTDIITIGRQAGSNANNRAISIGNQAHANANFSIAIGGLANTSNTGAVAIGANAHGAGQDSIAIGRNALAEQNSAIAIGGSAGNNIYALAPNSIAIGARATVRPQDDNSVAIGFNAQTTGSNQIMLGSADADLNQAGNQPHSVVIPGDLEVMGDIIYHDGADVYRFNRPQQIGGAGSYYLTGTKSTTSDIRLKNVGEKLTSGLEDIKKLEFFNYTFKDDKEQKPHVGVMAQDLQKVFPISVTEGSDGYLRIRWDEMFYAALNAIKELDNKITEIKTKVASYFDRVAKLEAQIDEQQKTIEELQKQNAEFKKRLAKIEKRGVGVKGVNNKIKTPALKSESEAE